MVGDKWNMRVYRRVSELKKAIERRDAALDRLRLAEEDYLEAKNDVKMCEIRLVVETNQAGNGKEHADER